ncbi:DUF4136 domain-containing protein [Methylibium sp.]|uniref:DUF4136 domain-containing protein n=1 Tax=Methylibium sp. TaxID=2067992 RepID=UPI003D0C0787
MQARQVFAPLAAFTAVAVLAGCAAINSVAVDVSSQGSWPADRKPGSYAIERLPSQQANAAEQDRIEAAALPAIEAAGFTRAPTEQADLLIQVGARVSEVLRRDPYMGHWAWRNDWWFYGGRRPFFYGPGFGFGPGFGYDHYDFPDYQREVGVLIRDRRSQQIVYETRAAYTSRWTSDALLPAMFEASMKDFPLPALTPRTVTVALPQAH